MNLDEQNNNQTSAQPTKPFEPKKLSKKVFVFLLVAIGLGLIISLWTLGQIFVNALLFANTTSTSFFIDIPNTIVRVLEVLLYAILLPFVIIHFLKPRRGIYLIVWLCLIACFGIIVIVVAFQGFIGGLSGRFPTMSTTWIIIEFFRIIGTFAIIALFTAGFVSYFKRAKK